MTLGIAGEARTDRDAADVSVEALQLRLFVMGVFFIFGGITP